MFVPVLVVLEVIWILRPAYNVSRQDIIIAPASLLQMHALELENQSTLRDFIVFASKSSYDLSDSLISQSAFFAGCEIL